MIQEIYETVDRLLLNSLLLFDGELPFCMNVCFTGLYCDTESVACFVRVFVLQGCIVIQEVFLVL